MNRLVIVWRVTGRCNLSCPFCAHDRTQDFLRRHASAALIRQFSAMLAGLERPVLMSWLGGEPLLWPPLTELTESLRREHGFAISTTTNGTTLHRAETRRHLIDNYAELTLSIDAFAPVHDELRGRSGLFEQVKQAARLLMMEKAAAGKGPLLRANVVLMRNTVADFPALCHELATWGIEEITCNQLGGIDRPEFYPDNRLLREQVTRLGELWPALKKDLAAKGVRLLGGEAYLRRLRATAENGPLVMEDCHPGEDFLFVTEDGFASPCSFTTGEYGVDLRQITNCQKLLELPQRFRQMRQRARATPCADCHSTQVCQKFTQAA
ncbi:MAG TPA: radical SAM protein [Prosthecobacter sp.]